MHRYRYYLITTAGALVAAFCIAPLALHRTLWIGTKRLTLTLPPGLHTESMSFYECDSTLDELITSTSPRDDFRKTRVVEFVDAKTVRLSLTTTGVDRALFDWLDQQSEPTFVLCLIEDAQGHIIHKLVAQNRRDSQTAIAVAIDDIP